MCSVQIGPYLLWGPYNNNSCVESIELSKTLFHKFTGQRERQYFYQQLPKNKRQITENDSDQE